MIAYLLNIYKDFFSIKSIFCTKHLQRILKGFNCLKKLSVQTSNHNCNVPRVKTQTSFQNRISYPKHNQRVAEDTKTGHNGNFQSPSKYLHLQSHMDEKQCMRLQTKRQVKSSINIAVKIKEYTYTKANDIYLHTYVPNLWMPTIEFNWVYMYLQTKHPICY